MKANFLKKPPIKQKFHQVHFKNQFPEGILFKHKEVEYMLSINDDDTFLIFKK